MHRSVATIDSPEFLNLQPLDINPLMSKCDIKIFYVGANRNRTFISEEVAVELGKTLRGAPIVGYYRDTKEDFTDHGEKIIIDDEGVKFQCQTVPYGFVSPDAKVWFQNFQDTDENGNTVIRKYLMTTGYLWTGQFPESSLPVNQGRPQSMELQKDSVKGQWKSNYQNGLDFFIINDAIIEKICILGDDVEPCFEGASVTAPDVSAKFTLDDNFKHTLFSMMQDLRNALNGGGQQMENLETTTVVVEETATQVDNNVSNPSAISDYVKKEEEEKKSEDKAQEDPKDKKEQDASSDSKETEDKKDEDDEDKKKTKQQYDLVKQFTELQSAFNALKESSDQLRQELEKLTQFKQNVDNQKKDALIAEFYMLSDEDKKDVIENKSKYTLDEIKSKLAVICFDKRVSFTSSEEQGDNSQAEVITTYNLHNDENNSSLPEWMKAVKEQDKLLGNI